MPGACLDVINRYLAVFIIQEVAGGALTESLGCLSENQPVQAFARLNAELDAILNRKVLSFCVARNYTKDTP